MASTRPKRMKKKREAPRRERVVGEVHVEGAAVVWMEDDEREEVDMAECTKFELGLFDGVDSDVTSVVYAP